MKLHDVDMAAYHMPVPLTSLIRVSVPLVGQYVHAGFPSPADDFIEAAVDLNQVLIANPTATFLWRVIGDCLMGQMPCTLCWYQRIAMFPLVLVLGIAAYRADKGAWRYALPLSALGLVLAAYHSLQYAGVIPSPIVPCSATGPSCSGAGMLVAGVPIPYLSAAAFAGITLLLLPLPRKSS